MSDLTDQQVLNWANLEKMVREIPNDRRFAMETWGQARDTQCGTAACMAGHAALNPHFRNLANPLNLEINWDLNANRGTLEVGNRHEVFGNSQLPFEGDWIREQMFDEDDYRDYETGSVEWTAMELTPEICADSIERFILEFQDVHAKDWRAAQAAATASYDVEWVHKLTPWNKEFDVEEFFTSHGIFSNYANGQTTAKGWLERDLS